MLYAQRGRFRSMKIAVWIKNNVFGLSPGPQKYYGSSISNGKKKH